MHLRHSLFALLITALTLASLMPAVALASEHELELPWSCHQAYRVSQGHESGTHTGFGAWAWDFDIGEGTLVTAPADGVVRMVRDDSTSHGCASEFAWDANYVVLDLGAGLDALFLHLRAGSARVIAGQSVRRGEPLGEVGNSGWVCGTHLHFQLQQSCRSWWCPSVPATFFDAGDPTKGQRLVSKNCVTRATCLVAAGSERIVDERDPCFRRNLASRWWEQPGGYEERFDYTFATATGEPTSEASWHFEVELSGRYEIAVFVPPGADARQARYFVDIGQRTYSPPPLDQSAHAGWVSLGNFGLTAGKPASVRLPTNTGDPSTRRIAFDAIRITPVFHPSAVAAVSLELDPMTVLAQSARDWTVPQPAMIGPLRSQREPAAAATPTNPLPYGGGVTSCVGAARAAAPGAHLAWLLALPALALLWRRRR